MLYCQLRLAKIGAVVADESHDDCYKYGTGSLNLSVPPKKVNDIHQIQVHIYTCSKCQARRSQVPPPRRTKERPNEEVSLRAHQGTKMNKWKWMWTLTMNVLLLLLLLLRRRPRRRRTRRTRRQPTKPAAPAGDETVDEAGDEAVVVASGDEGSEVNDAGAGGDEVEDAGAGGDEDQIEVSDDGMPRSAWECRWGQSLNRCLQTCGTNAGI